MKKILSIAVMAVIAMAVGGETRTAISAELPSADIVVNAKVTAACQEALHGAFPNPLMIETQSATDQIFAPSADELVRCSNGMFFTVKVSSANGTAVGQTCTSGGVSGMALKSASWPGDMVAYTFMCAGDTDGAGHFTGAGYNTAKALGISIKVLQADAQAAFAHADYSDTVTLTLSY